MDANLTRFLEDYPDVVRDNLAVTVAGFRMECVFSLALLNCELAEDATEDCVCYMVDSVGFLGAAQGLVPAAKAWVGG